MLISFQIERAREFPGCEKYLAGGGIRSQLASWVNRDEIKNIAPDFSNALTWFILYAVCSACIHPFTHDEGN